MKNIVILLIASCLWLPLQAQEGVLLIDRRVVADFSEMPFYPNVTEERDGQIVYKADYAYLDSIEVSWITYLSDGLKVRGLLVMPKAAGDYPCVIFNRGGNREFGALKTVHGALTLGKIAREGYVVVASQYRGNGGSEGQEEFGGSDVNDVLALVDVLGEVEGADTGRIGMYGWSRGGMMTFLALTRSDKIKAAAVGGALSDLTMTDRPEMEKGVYAELIPDYGTNKEEELRRRSAVYWADQFPKDVPVLLLHGNADWRVKSSAALRLALELDAHRVPYRLVVYEGGDHGLDAFRDEVHREIIRWFDRYVKRGAAAPKMEYHGE